jgi:hypothetical protein
VIFPNEQPNPDPRTRIMSRAPDFFYSIISFFGTTCAGTPCSTFMHNVDFSFLFFSSAQHAPFVNNCTSCITLTSAFSARGSSEHVLINIINHSFRIVLLFIKEELKDTKIETCENVTMYWCWCWLFSSEWTNCIVVWGLGRKGWTNYLRGH